MTYEGPPVVDSIKNELEQLLKYVLRNYTLYSESRMNYNVDPVYQI